MTTRQAHLTPDTATPADDVGYYQFRAWEAQRRACPLLAKDAEKAAKAFETRPKAEPTAQPTEPAKPARGRPKTIYANPVAKFMHIIAVPELKSWAASIIHGSISTSAGRSGGKINVKQRAVVNALFLSEITAEACMGGGIALRTAQRVAKAARHAAHGIATYLELHPKARAELDIEARCRSWEF